MSTYPAPYYTPLIFNQSVYTYPDAQLTIKQGDERYLNRARVLQGERATALVIPKSTTVTDTITLPYSIPAGYRVQVSLLDCTQPCTCWVSNRSTTSFDISIHNTHQNNSGTCKYVWQIILT